MKRFLLFCSGVIQDILENCPTDVNKYVGLGGTVLVTAGMAAASSYLFATIALRLSSYSAFFLSALVSLAIFNLDRWLLCSLSRQETFQKEVMTALPRLVMSVLIGVVISEPMVLTIYAPEINAQLARNQAAARRSAQERIDASPRFQQMAALQDDNDALQNQLDTRRAQEAALYQASIEEAEGTSGSGVEGKGSLYHEKQQRLAEQKAERSVFQKSAEARIRANQERLDNLQKEKDEELRVLDAEEGQSGGLLAREKALEQLTDQDPLLRRKQQLFALFLIMIDCLPIFSKLMQSLSRRSPYAALLEAEEEKPIQQARVLSEDVRGQADCEIAGQQSQRIQLAEMERDNSQRIVQRLADARFKLAETIIAAWEKREEEKILADLDAYLS